ncbi:AraC family transcriptional regulator [Lapidilactobacillus luobeiensis]|uniref:AraC family transcriptional regulator n=1 Tax=Lapidilactobacillus luobeiensis TaxID=2950371 RepID=UPI0021C337FE|nr:AraC family transcriptional regulator [Lapidilactobacillus luobeiensis]
MSCELHDLELSFQLGTVHFQVLNLLDGVIRQVIPQHHHGRTSYEIHYIASGYGTVVVAGKQYELTPGMLYMTGPGVDHAQIPQQKQPMREFCVYLKVSQDQEYSAAAPVANTATTNLTYFLATPFWLGPDQQDLRQLFTTIFTELTNQESGFQITLNALFQQLIVKMILNYQGQPQQERPQGALLPADRLVVTIEDYFLHDYQKANLSDLAQKIGTSPRQAERWLQRLYGQSFREKKTEARMSAAMMLLLYTEQSITAIGGMIGFSSLEHFSHAFKKYYGKSPRVFRQTAQSLAT